MDEFVKKFLEKNFEKEFFQVEEIKKIVDEQTDKKLLKKSQLANKLGTPLPDRSKIMDRVKEQTKNILIPEIENRSKRSQEFLDTIKQTNKELHNKIMHAISNFKEIVEDKGIESSQKLLSKEVRDEIYEVGARYAKSGDYEKGASALNFLCNFEAYNSGLKVTKGLMEMSSQKFELAIGSFGEALYQDPSNIEAYLMISMSLIMMDKKDEAKKIFELFTSEFKEKEIEKTPYLVEKYNKIKSILNN